MHDKPIVKCPNCGNTDIIIDKHLCKCMRCTEMFLLHDRTRTFDCSDYEENFTFWYISNDVEYINIV